MDCPYELWDIPSGNLMGSFPTRAEALAVVRREEVASPGIARDWMLGVVADPPTDEPIVEGESLRAEALGILAS